MTDNGMIEVFRGDEQGGFSPRYFLSFSFVFLCFYSFVFSGFIRGQRPFIVLRRRLPVSLPVLFYLSPCFFGGL